MNIIAIDPGYAKKGEGCACALIQRGALASAWFLRPGDFFGFKHPVPFFGEPKWFGAVIWERPQHRARDKKFACVPPETLISLAVAGATLAGLYAGACGAEIVEVHPSEWKGSLPKPVQHKALWDRLTDAERRVFVAVDGGSRIASTIIDAIERGAHDRWAKDGASYYPRGFTAHNLLDAVGIGKWYLRKIGATKQ
jgi:hypothetical protein